MADVGPATGDSIASDAALYEVAAVFLREFFRGTARQRSRRLSKAPLSAIQVAALRHPDPFTRKECLFFLDHYANDQSLEVFSAALEDPVDFVRNLAMHSLACTSCKVEALDAAQVVPGLVQVISSDPRPDLRLRAISMLLHLAPGDGAARTALEAAATNDPDPLTRHAAVGALKGSFVAPRKRYERTQRTHARTARRIGP
jgi:HEAT repeat protein